MKFASMLRRLRNTQSGMGSTARSRSTPYEPYTPSTLVVEAGSDQIVSQGATVKFTGSVSNAPASVVLNYKWTFGDEQNPTAVGNGRMVSYTYTTYGDKTVKLTVSYTGTDGKQVEGSDTLKVKVIFIEPKTVNDGERVEFQVLGAWDATSFAWYSRYPRKAGNEPGVEFSPDYLYWTAIERAKWFAWPNRACGPENLVARRSSEYEIFCDLTFPGLRPFTATATLTVTVPVEWTKEAGGVIPAVEIDYGETEYVTEIDELGNTIWKIKPETLKATRTLRQEFNIPNSSYFYDKMRRHEDRHVEQFNSGGIAADLYNVPATLWNYSLVKRPDNPLEDDGISLKFAQGTSKGLLRLSMGVRLQRFRDEEDVRLEKRRAELERDAYMISDGIPPQYIFQRCGRFA